MSILQILAMATNNRKDNLFLLISTYLLPFQELASVNILKLGSLVKTIPDNTLFEKMKNVSTGFLKIVQFHILD